MIADQLKRKLKELRQAEIAIRFGRLVARPNTPLVWQDFFALKPGAHPVRYAFDDLLRMNRDQLRTVFSDFLAFVYYQYYRENGLALESAFDPRLLAQMGLPPHANAEDIKKRFRDLAKKYHPDHGGDSQSFIELMVVYNRLTE